MPAPSSTYGDLFSPEGVQTRWNASSITAYQKCPRFYHFTNIIGWHSRNSNIHLRFGTHYAEAMQNYYLARAAGKTRDEAILISVRQAMLDTWDDCVKCGGTGEIEPADGEFVPGLESAEHTVCPVCAGAGSHAWDPEAEGHPKGNLKNRWTLVRSIVCYFEEFAKDELPIYELHNEPAVELKFELPVLPDISFVGTLDQVVRWGPELFIRDQKTTGSSLSSYYFDDFQLNHQVYLYTFAGQCVFNIDVAGTMIDAVQLAVGFSAFARQAIHLTDAQLQEWYDFTIPIIRRAQDDTARGEFLPNLTSCSMYGGCTFRSICSRSPEVRQNFLRRDFALPEASS